MSDMDGTDLSTLFAGVDPDLLAAAAPGLQACASGGNSFNGYTPVRISAVFVILVTSLFGAVFPIFARRHASKFVPEWAFFIAKFFGSGVIIATAFIHLLAPANENFSSPCIANTTFITVGYPWPSAIALMTIFVLFLIELMTMRFATFAPPVDQDSPNPAADMLRKSSVAPEKADIKANGLPGDDHLGHVREHVDNEEVMIQGASFHDLEAYSAQLTGIFILEFGVIFHSVFIGLTLAVSDWDDFKILYIVIVFHQMFEGLGLGSRLASVPWPKGKHWTPWVLGTVYAFTTPVAIAIGLGVSTTITPGSVTGLITNCVFDSISSGILIYTGLVELLAHEFMFSPDMRRASLRYVLFAFFTVCLGAGLMALLGKWA